jgi:hypothetical protein
MTIYICKIFLTSTLYYGLYKKRKKVYWCSHYKLNFGFHISLSVEFQLKHNLAKLRMY